MDAATAELVTELATQHSAESATKYAAEPSVNFAAESAAKYVAEPSVNFAAESAAEYAAESATEWATSARSGLGGGQRIFISERPDRGSKLIWPAEASSSS
ncbi:unnamed protein product, partial [Laminaria digitata]